MLLASFGQQFSKEALLIGTRNGRRYLDVALDRSKVKAGEKRQTDTKDVEEKIACKKTVYTLRSRTRRKLQNDNGFDLEFIEEKGSSG